MWSALTLSGHFNHTSTAKETISSGFIQNDEHSGTICLELQECKNIGQ